MLFVQVINLKDHPNLKYHFLKVEKDNYFYTIMNPVFPIREISCDEFCRLGNF